MICSADSLQAMKRVTSNVRYDKYIIGHLGRIYSDSIINFGQTDWAFIQTIPTFGTAPNMSTWDASYLSLLELTNHATSRMH